MTTELFAESTWQSAWASVPGRSHVMNDRPCEDAVAIWSSPAIVTAAICDGAGSASQGKVGAEIVSQELSKYLGQNFSSILEGRISLKQIIQAGLTKISEVSNASTDLSDYACTLVAVAISGDSGIAVHIGDGLIAFVKAGQPFLLSGPVNGELANQTIFVTSREASQNGKLIFFKIPPLVETFALMTDGCQAALYQQTTGQISQVIEQIACSIESKTLEDGNCFIADVLKHYIATRTSDDCSLAILRKPTDNQNFVCHSCRRWDLVRQLTGKKALLVSCSVCGAIVFREGHHKKGYHPKLLSWVLHMHQLQHMSIKQIANKTKLKERRLRKWCQNTQK